MSTVHPLTRFRTAAELTQAELGRRLGVGKNTVSRWEARVRTPEPKLWARIKEVTNGEVTIDDFTPSVEGVSQ